MLNADDFIKRLEFIMEHFNLNASSFADKINVQRSSISHLLSGRNKPSLDFVLKVIDVFPELSLYWFLNGSGSYLKEDPDHFREDKNSVAAVDPVISLFEKNANEIMQEEKKLNSDKEANTIQTKSEFIFKAEKQIDKIIILYTDGTFAPYNLSDVK